MTDTDPNYADFVDRLDDLVDQARVLHRNEQSVPRKVIRYAVFKLIENARMALDRLEKEDDK